MAVIMARLVPHIRNHATSRVRYAGLLLAAVLAFAGLRQPTIESSGENVVLAPAVGTSCVPASVVITEPVDDTFARSALDGSSWAVRDVNIQMPSERVSERKPTSERGIDADATRRITTHPPAQCATRSAAFHDATPPQALYQLHSALLI